MTPTMSPFSFTVWPVDSNKVNKAAYSLGPGLQILRWQMLLSFFLRVKTFINTVLLPVELAMFYHLLSPELINSPAPRDLDYLPLWPMCGCGVCECMERSQDNLVKLVFSIHLSVHRGNRTQVTRLAQQTSLPAELSLFFLLLYWFVKLQLYFSEFLSLHGFELGLTMRKTCTLLGKQKWNSSGYHLKVTLLAGQISTGLCQQALDVVHQIPGQVPI